MTRAFLLASTLMIAATSAVLAQTSQMPAEDSTTNGGAGIRSNNITSTGETVPNPGSSQGAGTTSMDRGIQQHDNEVDSSICKGC